jgi:hypothetical protein
VIPYLSTIDLTGQRTGRASSFGYSDCLKWGKTGDMAIKVASFNARQAAGILGLDLTRVSAWPNIRALGLESKTLLVRLCSACENHYHSV